MSSLLAHSRSRISVCVLSMLLTAEASPAAAYTPVSQFRRVQSDSIDATTGYACLGPFLLPDCPVDLGTTTPSDAISAPDFAPFSATAAAAGGSASQTSSIGPTLIQAVGTSSVAAGASDSVTPPYILILDTSDPTTDDDFLVTFDLDQQTAFAFEASGQIVYPDPSFPLLWDIGLDVVLTGPGGEVAAFGALPDFGCLPNAEFLCVVAPTPLMLTGTLAPGQYTLAVQLDASAAGNWLPSVGSLAGFADGSYTVRLSLANPQSLPASSAVGLTTLGAVFSFFGRRFAARAKPSPR